MGIDFLAQSMVPMMGYMVVLIFITFAIVIGAIVFWFWMLVDALKKKHFEDKLVWVLVLIFLNIVGALLYYIIVYKEKRRSWLNKK